MDLSKINGLCILKPGFLDYLDYFIQCLNEEGWDITEEIYRKLSLRESKSLYESQKDTEFYKELCNYMSSSESYICACYKDCENPIDDMNNFKELLRDKFSKDKLKNFMHSSDSLNNLIREYKLLFKVK